jgi:hypothetical protein
MLNDISKAYARIYLDIINPSNKAEFAKAAKIVIENVHNNYYSRDDATS